MLRFGAASTFFLAALVTVDSLSPSCRLPMSCASVHRNVEARTWLRWGRPRIRRSLSTNGEVGDLDGLSSVESQDRLPVEEEEAMQWDLFKKHHARGSWQGTWTTYDYLGDVVDTATGSVDLIYDAETETVNHVHRIVAGVAKSDCSTCFDSEDVRTVPIGTYQQGQMGRHRTASVALATGPSLLRSGLMTTELALASQEGDRRVRVLFQHAPAWERGVEPGMGPPQGLKLLRTMVAIESLAEPPETTVARQWRGVPPYAWRRNWGGTSWTWGPQSGDRGWRIDQMDEADAWHGRPMGDTDNVWSLRLNAVGVLLQCPRVVRPGELELCRLAWNLLPLEEGPAELLRVEASVVALQPRNDENDQVVAFAPPSLGSLRCDVLRSIGDLVDDGQGDDKGAEGTSDPDETEGNSGLEAIRNAMQF